MRVGAVVHARMGSSRLPGKSLGDLAGRPALAWLVERMQHCEALDDLVVATSTEPEDTAVEDWCREGGVACHRGPLEDVARRVLDAAQARGLDALVRVNGDSPLLDQRLVARGVALMRDSGPDLVTNVRPRSFPPGQSVEVLRTEALERAVAEMDDAESREHVTGWLYRHPDRFAIERFEADVAVTEPPMTLDTAADHERLEGILRRMERPHWEYTWSEALELAGTRSGC